MLGEVLEGCDPNCHVIFPLVGSLAPNPNLFVPPWPFQIVREEEMLAASHSRGLTQRRRCRRRHKSGKREGAVVDHLASSKPLFTFVRNVVALKTLQQYFGASVLTDAATKVFSRWEFFFLCVVVVVWQTQDFAQMTHMQGRV